jgi:hypothetical protein
MFRQASGPVCASCSILARLLVPPVVHAPALEPGQDGKSAAHDGRRGQRRLPARDERVPAEEGHEHRQARGHRPGAVVRVEVVETKGHEVGARLLHRADHHRRQRLRLRHLEARRLGEVHLSPAVVLRLRAHEGPAGVDGVDAPALQHWREVEAGVPGAVRSKVDAERQSAVFERGRRTRSAHADHEPAVERGRAASSLVVVGAQDAVVERQLARVRPPASRDRFPPARGRRGSRPGPRSRPPAPGPGGRTWAAA